MKFGKRLAAEAARGCHADNYCDYKALKHAIKQDIEATDADGTRFQQVLIAELQKVSAYHSRKSEQLESTLRQCQEPAVAAAQQLQAAQLAELRSEVQELIKFVALNYLAVVKSIKKRNRHLKEHFGEAVSTSLHALDLLLGEVFFTSPRLATLATQAEVLAQQAACNASRCCGPQAVAPAPAAATAAPTTDTVMTEQEQQHLQQAKLLEEYSCPICLDTLHNPVVLTCAHRFCWGCLVAHCTATRDALVPLGSSPPPEHSPGSVSPQRKPDDPEPTALPPTTYRVLEQLATRVERPEASFYACPVCRKPQILDIDTLQVDAYLDQFITSLQHMSAVTVTPTPSPPPAGSVVVHATRQHGSSTGGSSTVTITLPPPEHLTIHTAARAHSTEVLPSASLQPEEEHWGLIPPPAPHLQGKLCVLLDLDGTLVSSFTPKRAPRLPSYVRTHIVGVGSKLNPGGVFVVERPGLAPFLDQLSAFAEVVVFTAGLEEYASPIIDAIDPHRKYFAHRIYREGTRRTEHYQCVKDMGWVGRALGRVCLVDDTPLAFLHQPDNGVPVLGFRGDPDDRLLLEAVLPLLQSLAAEKDVRGVLHRRFDMSTWFKRHGFPVDAITQQATADAREARARALVKRPAQGASAAGGCGDGCAGTMADSMDTGGMVEGEAGPPRAPACLEPLVCPPVPPTRDTLLLMDFDKTLTDFDAGERVVEALAPELLPMLMGITGRTSYIPVTVTVLAEMQRRGVTRDDLLSCLHRLGSAELPAGSLHLLRIARAAGVPVTLLSDANSVFISHILAGARAMGLVQHVVTNTAAFEPVPPPSGIGRPTGHKLVIRPLHGTGSLGGSPTHRCSLCPDNLCKGREVRAVRAAGTYRRIVFAGDGRNDICPALCLGPQDVVLARDGHPLADFVKQGGGVSCGGAAGLRVQAQVHLWTTHDELAGLVQGLLGHA